MYYRWDFSVISVYSALWFKGAGITLLYALGTVVGGLVIGIVCGMALLYRRRWATLPIHLYVEVFRCTPLLVQIIWFYYALPIVLRIELPAWLAAGLGLMLYMGAFATEIFRGGIISIDRGQWQAARALGMTYFEMMRHVILPQAARRMVPPLKVSPAPALVAKVAALPALPPPVKVSVPALTATAPLLANTMVEVVVELPLLV